MVLNGYVHLYAVILPWYKSKNLHIMSKTHSTCPKKWYYNRTCPKYMALPLYTFRIVYITWHISGLCPENKVHIQKAWYYHCTSPKRYYFDILYEVLF